LLCESVPWYIDTSAPPNWTKTLRDLIEGYHLWIDLSKELTEQDLDRMIRDVVQVEAGIIAFSLVAFGLLLNAISTYNQINFGIAQVPGGRFYGYIPLGPTMLNFTFIAICDALSLSTGLISRIAPRKYSKLKSNLLLFSVCFLILSLVFFTWTVWSARFAFFYQI